MRKNEWKRWGALGLAAALTLSMGACGSGNDDTGKKDPDKENSGKADPGKEDDSKKDDDKKELTRITVYPPSPSVSSGVVGGWKGEYFASRGLEVEVWANSEDKTNAIVTSGDLPDIMYTSMAYLDDLIETGKIVNLDDYLDDIPHVATLKEMETALKYVRKFKSADTGSVYGLPTSIGDNGTVDAVQDSTNRRGLKIKWETYEAIGAPKIESPDDVIDVMEQMVAYQPTDENGTPYWGTILHNGSDTSYWGCMQLWDGWFGYEEWNLPCLLETNMYDGTVDSILKEDSVYHEGLKWYNKVYRRGLLNIDDMNRDRQTQKAKVDSGYAMVPMGDTAGWAPGFLEYYFPGEKVYYSFKSPYGGDLISINAKTENLEACLTYLDIMCDPDANLWLIQGPDGEFWESDGNGNIFPTERAMEYMKNDTSGSPQEFVLSTGEKMEFWTMPCCLMSGVHTTYKNGKGEYRNWRVDEWDEWNEIKMENPMVQKWKTTTGHDSWKEWLGENYRGESTLDSVSQFCALADPEMSLTIQALRDTVVNASWKMVYANSDEEFDSIWDAMVKDCEGLGAQEVMDWRIQCIEEAKEVKKSLE